MKIVFLDIDGVLNIMSDSYRTFMKPYGQHIEPHLVERLNYLIEKTDSHIVISSSWKSNMEDLEKQMVEQGFKYWDRVLGRTPFSGEFEDCEFGGYRGNQIKKWLDETAEKIDSYCIIEDEPSDVCGSRCRAILSYYVVPVDMTEGLSQNDINRALYILEKGIL